MPPESAARPAKPPAATVYLVRMGAPAIPTGAVRLTASWGGCLFWPATPGLPRLFTLSFDKEGGTSGWRRLTTACSRGISLAARARNSGRTAAPRPKGQERHRSAGGASGPSGGQLCEPDITGRTRQSGMDLRTFLESDTVKATLALVQGMRTLSSLEGPGTAPHGTCKMTPEIEQRMHLLLRDDAVGYR